MKPIVVDSRGLRFTEKTAAGFRITSQVAIHGKTAHWEGIVNGPLTKTFIRALPPKDFPNLLA